MTLEQQQALALAQAKRKRAEAAAAAPAGPANDGIGSAIGYGFKAAARNTAEGLSGAAGWLADYGVPGAQSVENFYGTRQGQYEGQIAKDNYSRPTEADGIWKNIKEGDAGGALESLAYGAAESAPSIATGLAASLTVKKAGLAAKLIAGGLTTSGFLQALGGNKQDQRAHGIDTPTDAWDFAAAGASSIIELLPFGHAASTELKAAKEVLKSATATSAAKEAAKLAVVEAAKKAAKEGFLKTSAKEGIQEGLQQATTIADTEAHGGNYAPGEMADSIIDSAITGGLVSGGTKLGIGATDAVASAVLPSRTDKGHYDASDAKAAEALLAAAGGSSKVLGNVSTTDAQESAQGHVKAALKSLRAEESTIAAGLMKHVRAANDQAGEIAIKALVAEGADFSVANTEDSIKKVQSAPALKGQADLERLAVVHRAIGKIDGFAQAGGDFGGISKMLTRFADPTDARNPTLSRAISSAAHAAASFSPVGVVGPLMTTGGAIGLNMAAKGVDRITNRRSRVKRYVDSVAKSGAKQTPITGPNARETMDEMVKQAKALKKAQDDALKLAASTAKLAQGNTKQTDALSKGLADRARIGRQSALTTLMGTRNTQAVFDGGDIPEGVGYHDGYKKWEEHTGSKTGATLEALQSLEGRGMVPTGTAHRFRNDIRSFPTKGKGKRDTYELQEMVRQVNNPEHSYGKKSKADAALSKLNEPASLEAIGKSTKGMGNAKFKMAEGIRRSRNVIALIEAEAGSMSANKLKAFYALHKAMDSQQATVEDRYALMEEFLPSMVENPAELALWTKRLTPLAEIGNEVAIASKHDAEPVKEEALAGKVKDAEKQRETAVAKKAKKPKAKKDPVTPPEVAPVPEQAGAAPVPTTTAERALAKLDAPTTTAAAPEVTPTTSVEDTMAAEEPTPAPLDQSKAAPRGGQSKGRTGINDMVHDRAKKLDDMEALYTSSAQDLADAIAALPKSPAGRLEGMIYDMANGQMTVNMMVDRYASMFDVPVTVAANVVFNTLTDWQAQGHVKLVWPTGGNKLRVDGEFKKDVDGKSLDVLAIKIPKTSGLYQAFEVAKAVKSVEKMVNINEPDVEFSTKVLANGPHKAFKDIPADQIDDTFNPMITFLNKMREMRFVLNPRVLDMVESGLETGHPDVLNGALNPVTDTYVNKAGKLSNNHDDSGARAMAQIMFQFGKAGERTDTSFRQEVMAGRNLRAYTKNGFVHSQAGDFMKGLMRSSEMRAPGPEGLGWMFHSFGNLLGMDKAAPEARRGSIFQPGMIDTLLKFAENPTQRQQPKRNGEPSDLMKVLKDGEGFFQVLNVADEVTQMVAFAKARFPKKSGLSPEALLKDHDVQDDLASNYKTNFIAQMDASNNAYQISGLVMGYADVLKATGLVPRDEVTNPDSVAGADIYMTPAKATVARVPDLAALNLPDTSVRKLFKSAIGTYLYAAEFESRREGFAKVLQKIAGKGHVVSVDDEGGLIEMHPGMKANLLSEQGHVFTRDHYNVEGDIKSSERVANRVVKDGERFVIETGKLKDNEVVYKAGGRGFETESAALRSVYEQDLYGRMNRELIRDFETRYPRVREYLNFSQKLSEMVKGDGQNSDVVINVPTPDGMMLQYAFKDNVQYAGVPLAHNGKVISLGVRTDDVKLKGRGMAAFMTHMLDAFVLRETHRRMDAEGRGNTFNPIHDSFGFHPADATRGQELALEVMQALGDGNFNIFLNILHANGIDPADFIRAGGTIPQRNHVEPQPAKAIPTAIS